MRSLMITLALTLFRAALAQKPTTQILNAGRCHKAGDLIMKVRLNCIDNSGSLFCGVLSSTLRSLPKTEIAYSDAHSDIYLRVSRVSTGAGFYLGQPYLFQNGHSTGATHYLKEGSATFGTDDGVSKFVREMIVPSIEPARAEFEQEVPKRPVTCPVLTDEEDHEQ